MCEENEEEDMELIEIIDEIMNKGLMNVGYTKSYNGQGNVAL